ncbi:MAG: sigma-70 family RNA polymerase sigma factor [Candidatus Gastranaerophilales bacterium]|nr:sigma-70 family RNA polymerase sigma factor [Candidatus Gastranaerophilales bacterium]
MNLKTESTSKKFNIKDYMELIETLAKVEYKKLSSNHLMEFSELVNIGTQVIHKLCSNVDENTYNKSYLSTAIKWAIRNEVRRRYKWYVLKNKRETGLLDAENPTAVREAVYKTILSIDELAEGESPTQIKDSKRTPEEKIVFHELSESIKEAIKKLPPREKELIECKFYKDKKLREIAEEFNLSPSRISRIIQAGLNKIRKELVKQNLV